MKNWLNPANVKLYNVLGAFNNEEIIAWGKTTNVLIGDVVYIYLGAPHKQIMYKCEVLSTNLDGNYVDAQAKKYVKGSKKGPLREFMGLKVVRNFGINVDLTFALLKENGL